MQPEENFILFINVPKSLINSTCSKYIHTIEGTALLHFLKHCDVNINGVKYRYNYTIFWDKVHIVPSIYKQIRPKSVIETVNLQKLGDYHFECKEAILMLQQDAKKNATYTYRAISILGILVISATYFAVKKLKINTHRTHQQLSVQPHQVPCGLYSILRREELRERP